MKSEVKFADKNLGYAFQSLKNANTEDKKLYDWLKRAIEDIEENAFCGIQIPKRLIPGIYIKKFDTNNLWKYDLPKGWRLLYTIGKDGAEIISILLEWLDHKEYERRFNY